MTAVVVYKVGAKRIAKVCENRIDVAILIDRLTNKFDELAVYANWSATGRVETCSLTRNRGCVLVKGAPRFKRLARDASLRLIIAVKRQKP